MIEIQVPIKGEMNDIVNMLQENGLTLVHYGRVVANYYLPKDAVVDDPSKLKDLCVRIRKCVKDEFVDDYAIYHWEWIDENLSDKKDEKEINIDGKDKIIEIENNLLNDGYKLIYTDIKDDNILVKNADDIFTEDNIIFQIQDLKGIGLTCATDRGIYKGLPEEEQRRLLIKDMNEYGLEEISKEDINRFGLLDDPNYKPMNLEEVIEYLKEYVKNK